MKDCFDDTASTAVTEDLVAIFGPALDILKGARLSNAPKTRGERIAWAQTLYDLRPDMTAEVLMTAVRRLLTAQPAEESARFWPTPSDLCTHLPPAPLNDGAAWDRLYSRACLPIPVPATDDARAQEEARCKAWEAIVGRFDPAQRDVAAQVRTALRAKGMRFASLTPEQVASARERFIARCQQARAEGLQGAPEIAVRPERRILPAPVETPEEDRVSAADFERLLMKRVLAPKRPDPDRAARLRLVEPLKREEEEAVLADLRAHQQSRKGGM